jgi:hypothetical protein
MLQCAIPLGPTQISIRSPTRHPRIHETIGEARRASCGHWLKPPPQTQGKVERFHQTMKKYLAKQPPTTTKRQLQGQLDRFVTYYNELRPHRALDRKRPIEVFTAREKAPPQGARSTRPVTGSGATRSTATDR